MSERIAIVGGGKIGEALLAGLIQSGKQTKDLVVAEKMPKRAKEIADEYGVLVTDVTSAAEGAQYVFLAIKPDDVDAVLRELSSASKCKPVYEPLDSEQSSSYNLRCKLCNRGPHRYEYIFALQPVQ